MDNQETIANMIDKIIDGDNIGAQEDFTSIIATKMTQALDARKQELAQNIYQDQQEDGTEQEITATVSADDEQA